MKTNRLLAKTTEAETFGLVASGIAGDWEVSVDETVSGPQRWLLEIDGPTWYVDFRIAGRDVVREILEFLTGHAASDGSARNGTQLGKDEVQLTFSNGTAISLIWDTETNARCFVLIAGGDGLHARLTLDYDDLAPLADAFRQIENEWTD